MKIVMMTDGLTAAEYNALRVSVGWKPATEGQAERGLRHTTFQAVARDGEQAVAMGRALFNFGYTAYIGDVIVAPSYQGRGIGRRIVESLLAQVTQAAEADDRIMFLLGAAKGKEAFYEKFGFHKRPNEKDGYGMTLWQIAE